MRLLVVESNDIVRAGIAALLQTAGHQVFQACTSEHLLTSAEEHVFDAAIIGEDLFEDSDTDHVVRLKHLRPSLRLILLLSTSEHALIRDADGIILRDATADQLLACIDSVCAGHRWADPFLLDWLVQGPMARLAVGHLTPREFGVAALIGRGLRNKEIAREMKLSEATVKMHLHHIYEKLHLNGRTVLALRARELSEVSNHHS